MLQHVNQVSEMIHNMGFTGSEFILRHRKRNRKHFKQYIENRVIDDLLVTVNAK